MYGVCMHSMDSKCAPLHQIKVQQYLFVFVKLKE